MSNVIIITMQDGSQAGLPNMTHYIDRYVTNMDQNLNNITKNWDELTTTTNTKPTQSVQYCVTG